MAFWDKFRKKSPTAPVASARRGASSKTKKAVKETTAVAEEPRVASTVKKDSTGDAYRLLLAPIVTEKAASLGSGNQYVFAVSRRANKLEVRRAVESVYGVRPARVRILNVRGRAVRYGRAAGRTAAWKKAIVTLGKGDKIQVFEGV